MATEKIEKIEEGKSEDNTTEIENKDKSTEAPPSDQKNADSQTNIEEPMKSNPSPATANSGKHTSLHSTWTFWFDKKSSNSNKKSEKFENSLTSLGSFSDVEGFWSHYAFLKKPNDLPKNSNMRLFRGTTPPTWEKYSNGGCWTIRFVKDEHMTRIWEELVFAAIGERFEEVAVVGVVISVRSKEDYVSVWIKNDGARFRVGEKIKSILHLDSNTQIEYKSHSKSLKDNSTYRNTQLYVLP